MQARLGITNFLVSKGLAKVELIRSEDGSTLENAYIRVMDLLRASTSLYLITSNRLIARRSSRRAKTRWLSF